MYSCTHRVLRPATSHFQFRWSNSESGGVRALRLLQNGVLWSLRQTRQSPTPATDVSGGGVGPTEPTSVSKNSWEENAQPAEDSKHSTRLSKVAIE